MSTELQLLGQDKRQADMFFDREPVMTDWNYVRNLVLLGHVTKEGCLAEIKAFEPLKEADPREHTHWIAQQKLRLTLLHEAGKPLEGKHTCEACGSRKVDPLYDDREWRAVCLHCAELDRQTLHERSRGSCEFLRPCYNPRSHSWGLLYYWSHGRDSTFIFWLADFYESRYQAKLALSPIHHYHQWLEIKYNGMIASWLSFSRLLPLSDLMKLSLPLTPDQFRAHLRSVIETDMSKEHEMMGYYVKEAMDEHERAERDQ
jgi:hypothetical protein